MPILVAAAATGVGLITGFFGVGGGFVVVPALVLVLGFDMPTAAGTSLVVIAVNSAAALAARAGHASLTLDWPLTGTFAAAAVIGALAGGSLAGRTSPQRLSAAFTRAGRARRRVHAHPQPPRPGVTRSPQAYTLPGIIR